jgi:hypothetical protein
MQRRRAWTNCRNITNPARSACPLGRRARAHELAEGVGLQQTFESRSGNQPLQTRHRRYPEIMRRHPPRDRGCNRGQSLNRMRDLGQAICSRVAQLISPRHRCAPRELLATTPPVITSVTTKCCWTTRAVTLSVQLPKASMWPRLMCGGGCHGFAGSIGKLKAAGQALDLSAPQYSSPATLARKSGQNNRKRGKDASRAACFLREELSRPSRQSQLGTVT